MDNWNKTKEILPKEKVKVKTLSESGVEDVMYRIGNLWFVGSSYVYYTPIMWKYL